MTECMPVNQTWNPPYQAVCLNDTIMSIVIDDCKEDAAQFIFTPDIELAQPDGGFFTVVSFPTHCTMKHLHVLVILAVLLIAGAENGAIGPERLNITHLLFSQWPFYSSSRFSYRFRPRFKFPVFLSSFKSWKETREERRKATRQHSRIIGGENCPPLVYCLTRIYQPSIS